MVGVKTGSGVNDKAWLTYEHKHSSPSSEGIDETRSLFPDAHENRVHDIFERKAGWNHFVTIMRTITQQTSYLRIYNNCGMFKNIHSAF